MSSPNMLATREKEFAFASAVWSYNLPRVPVRRPLNLSPETCGSFYDRGNGLYLGTICSRNPGEDVYAVEFVKKHPNPVGGVKIEFKNAEKLNITHKRLLELAQTVYGESTAYKLNNPTVELAMEMWAIAYVRLYRNKKAYGDDSPAGLDFKATGLERRTGNKQLANWAVIRALIDPFDPSHGANMWDGMEQAQYPESEIRGSVINPATRSSIELHMNTMGWNISDEHYAKWKQNVGAKFKAPQIRIATVGRNKGKVRLYSTTVYGGTIFWREQ